MTALLVSRLMPSYNRRPCFARAIRRFQREIYPSKELIILDHGGDCVVDLVSGDACIRYVCSERFASLGAKRNAACEEACGEYSQHRKDEDRRSPICVAPKSFAEVLASCPSRRGHRHG